MKVTSGFNKTTSELIRERIKAEGKRFHANDNISEFINEGEIQLLIDELTIKFDSVLDSLIIDRENDPNSMDTGRRLAKMYINEIMEGRYQPSPRIASFPNTGKGAFRGMLVVKTELKSVCSHHHQPVTGVAYIGIIPSEKVIGLSKYSRIAQHCARRGTLQEELTNDIAAEIINATDASDVAVWTSMEHGCCTNRGIMANDSNTVCTVLLGAFRNADVKTEFFDNIKIRETTR